jgi:hypothetical protein
MREWLEFAAAWIGLKALGILPRRAARFVGATFASAAYAFRAPLRDAAMFNLKLAYPDWSDEKRSAGVRGMIRQVGWMAGEFSQFPRYTAQNIRNIVEIDGEENFSDAQSRGKGVLFLTGHMSAWELSSFTHALYGHPLHFLVRPISNCPHQWLSLPLRQSAHRQKQIRTRDPKSLNLGRHGRNFGRPQHLARGGRLRKLLRDPGVDNVRSRSSRASHRCGSAPRFHSLGRSAPQIHSAFRACHLTGSYWRRRS